LCDDTALHQQELLMSILLLLMLPNGIALMQHSPANSGVGGSCRKLHVEFTKMSSSGSFAIEGGAGGGRGGGDAGEDALSCSNELNVALF
jgi:hypothetical protein